MIGNFAYPTTSKKGEIDMSRRRGVKRSQALLIALGSLAVVLFLMFSGIFAVNILKMNGSQFTLSAIIFIGTMIVGLLWKVLTDWQQSDANITWTELIVGGVIVGMLFSVIGVNVGWKMAVNSTIRYNEYWNGWELSAVDGITACERDGLCRHNYSCDPYVVLVPYSCMCDDKGVCMTCLRPETHYHSCPSATEEHTYYIQTTLGDYVVNDHVFSPNPVEWRPGSGIPDNVQRGPSQIWSDVRVRCEAGRPGPVTKRNSYDNYILASDTTLFKQYSSQIDAYKAAGLLPEPRRDVRDFYMADKVYFVGFKPVDSSAWQRAHAYFNAALGTELQGDLHLVIVQNETVTANPDAYAIALKAYWQGLEFGKDTISKNTVIVVLGTIDGTEVAWARATTGMPVGNEMMLTVIRNHLPGTVLTPEAVLGIVNGQFYQKTKSDGTTKLDVKGIGETGFLRRTLWGLDDPSTKFARVSMSAKDNVDNGTGFAYLKDQIRPSFGQQLTIVLVFLFLGVILWGVEAYYVGDLRNGYHW